MDVHQKQRQEAQAQEAPMRPCSWCRQAVPVHQLEHFDWWIIEFDLCPRCARTVELMPQAANDYVRDLQARFSNGR